MNSIRRLVGPVFDRIGRDNVTGLAAMVAYNLVISIVPFAILALWVGGQVIEAHSYDDAVARSLRAIFPGPTDSTLQSLLDGIKRGTPGVGTLALLGSIWTGMSFWGAIDTAFGRIYSLPQRGWLAQKRFAFLMLWLVIVFIAAVVAVPVVQTAIAAVRRDLPFGLDQLPGLALATSLAVGLALLFLSLWAIYALGPNGRLPWRSVWPGALAATTVIGVLDIVYPYYLTHGSMVWRYGTTAVFLVIVLLWFYAVSLVLLLGAELNAWRHRRTGPATGGPVPDSQASRSAAISRKQAT